MNRRTFLQSVLAILPASIAARLPFAETVARVEAVAPVVDDYWQLGVSGELITPETLNAHIGDNHAQTHD